jgi:hypothetical protein
MTRTARPFLTVPNGAPFGDTVGFFYGCGGMEEKIQEKIDTLLRYREALDEGEKEVFDILMGYANEVAMAIDGRAAGSGVF